MMNVTPDRIIWDDADADARVEWARDTNAVTLEAGTATRWLVDALITALDWADMQEAARRGTHWAPAPAPTYLYDGGDDSPAPSRYARPTDQSYGA